MAISPLLRASPAIIGREGDDLALALPFDHLISAHHAVLTYRDGRWRLADYPSRNGTFFGPDEQRVGADQVSLAPGTTFLLGRTDLMLTDDPELVRRATHSNE